MLERVLGAHAMPFHNEFWRGKTRTELVSTTIFDLPLFVPGKPDESHIIRALDKKSAGNGKTNSMISSYFSLANAEEHELGIIKQWIVSGCPEIGTETVDKEALTAAAVVDDNTHLKYWRAVDIFFLPGLASQETLPHVIRMHGQAFGEWVASMITKEDPTRWPDFLSKPEVVGSFNYIRHHQRRLIHEYYEDAQSNLFDSLWKFGGSLLPIDPESKALPEHRMNGVMDWFYWVPYLTASLTDGAAEPIDYSLARAWQIGIVADGLLRTDDERPVESRMPISDFNADDPDLFSKLSQRYQDAERDFLLSEMQRRTKESGIFG